jgi:hypothetical protein
MGQSSIEGGGVAGGCGSLEEEDGGGGVSKGSASGSATAEGGGSVRVVGEEASEVGGVGWAGDRSVRSVDEASVRTVEVAVGGDDVRNDAVVLAAPATVCTVVVLDVVVEVLVVVVVVVVTEVTSPSSLAVTARLLSPSAFVLKFSTFSIHLPATRRAWF